MKLSEHFTLEELTFSQTAARKGINNTPNNSVIENLKQLCVLLEEVRDVCGAPIRISSGYRSPALNVSIGGAKNSQHCLGQAADFTVLGLTVTQVIDYIIEAGLPYDQLIHEFDSWVHISIPNLGKQPRQEVLIIDKRGTRPYL